MKSHTTVVVQHMYYEAGETFDRLVWLGACNIHGKYVVRQVQFRQGPDGIVKYVRQGRRLGIIRPCIRLSIQAPEILPELLIPLPKDTVLCRQPCYRHKNPTQKPMSQQIEVHPQRDLLVALLMQADGSVQGSSKSCDHRCIPEVICCNINSQPDSSIVRPPWAFLQPQMALA